MALAAAPCRERELKTDPVWSRRCRNPATSSPRAKHPAAPPHTAPRRSTPTCRPPTRRFPSHSPQEPPRSMSPPCPTAVSRQSGLTPPRPASPARCICNAFPPPACCALPSSIWAPACRPTSPSPPRAPAPTPLTWASPVNSGANGKRIPPDLHRGGRSKCRVSRAGNHRQLRPEFRHHGNLPFILSGQQGYIVFWNDPTNGPQGASYVFNGTQEPGDLSGYVGLYTASTAQLPDGRFATAQTHSPTLTARHPARTSACNLAPRRRSTTASSATPMSWSKPARP